MRIVDFPETRLNDNNYFSSSSSTSSSYYYINNTYNNPYHRLQHDDDDGDDDSIIDYNVSGCKGALHYFKLKYGKNYKDTERCIHLHTIQIKFLIF